MVLYLPMHNSMRYSCNQIYRWKYWNNYIKNSIQLEKIFNQNVQLQKIFNQNVQHHCISLHSFQSVRFYVKEKQKRLWFPADNKVEIFTNQEIWDIFHSILLQKLKKAKNSTFFLETKYIIWISIGIIQVDQNCILTI